MYRYIESLDAPKQWFKANVDTILRLYSGHHPIQRGDLYLGAWVSLDGWLECSND